MCSIRLRDGTVPDIYFVDLDGTLVSRSSEKYFLQLLLRKRVLSAAGMLGFLSRYALHPLTTVREGKGWNRGYLRSVDPEDAMETAAECAAALLGGYLRPWTCSSIEELRAGGCAPVLMSASLEYITSRIAGALGVRDVCASIPEISEGRFTGRLTGPRPWGREKRKLAEDICRERGTELRRCAAAGDSWSDRFLLQGCGCAAAVCPDGRLGRMALEKGWTVVEGRHARWA